MSVSIPFKPGISTSSAGLLGRYLPPLPEGIVAAWLKEYVAPGAWVLDPFGTSPRLAAEAARAGYRVLVTANNPVTRRLFELAAGPPSEAELRAVLAELASAYKGDERIEPHIRSLYLTECADCSQPVQADYFLWERGAKGPYARVYHCPACGDAGERPATQADIERAARFATGGMHRARALERVAPVNDPDRAHAEEALSVYLPRAVYALFTLINRLDGLSLPAARRNLLDAILLNAFDGANTLWPHPVHRERPRQLTIPPRFRENNLWLALEQGVERLASQPQDAFPLVSWPARPSEEGGISLFEGRLKDLSAASLEMQMDIVLAAFPRPNQAFWTLSALWSGWLWGRESVGPFKSVLRRRRYDWAWHTAALSAALNNLGPLLQDGACLLGIIGEAEPGFMTAAMISAENAGFDLKGLALRAEMSQAQIVWENAQPEKAQPAASQNAQGSGEANARQLRQAAVEAAARFLRERGQPGTYLQVLTAALSAIAEQHAFSFQERRSGKETSTDLSGELPPRGDLSPAEIFSQVQSVLKDTFTIRSGFLRYEGSETSLDVGQWWLSFQGAKDQAQTVPLADRVEIACVRFLQKNPGCTWDEIERRLCEAFPGLHTPDPNLIHMCLDSYGEFQESNRPGWRLRNEDQPAARRADLDAARRMIQQLGAQLEFTVTLAGDQAPSRQTGTSIPYLWQDADGKTRYAFYIIASAAFGELVLRRDYPPEKALILLPGGRANLAAFKLRCDPHLRQEFGKGWRFLKYRHLRRLVEDQQITQANFDEQLALDPLTYSAPQIRLL